MPSTAKTSPPQVADVLIVGGGPAGLTCAVSVARNAHTAIVFDSGSYRNERTNHFHMLPTWDGKEPVAFRTAARQNTLDNYDSIFYEDVEIVKAIKDTDELFKLTDKNGKVWIGRGLVLATGIIDIPLKIPGFDECWARSMQVPRCIPSFNDSETNKLSRFHCLFCHGYEQRGSSSSGVLAIDEVAPIPFALHVSRNAAQLTDKVTIYTNGNDLSAQQLEVAIGPEAPVSVDSRPISRFVLGANETGVTIHFEDGATKDEAFLAHKPTSRLKSSFLAEQLGLELGPMGDLKISPPFGETTVGGCFAAGDNSSLLKTSPNAVNAGANSAAGVASHVQSRKYGQNSLSEFMQIQSTPAA